MATGRLIWRSWDGTPLDGSASNAGPALLPLIGTDAAPKKILEVAAFDASTAEYLCFDFRMPGEYLSGGTVTLQWMANATANSVVWAAKLAAVTAADADTPVEHAPATASTATTSVNTTEARRLTETSITLANLDSVAGGDYCSLIVYRDAANGSDTCTVDAELLTVELAFTV
jgi:hypothetical protein